MKSFDCDVYTDLMPLVKDGAASDATRQVLAQHLETCASCRALFDSLPDAPPPADDAAAAKTLAKLRRNFAFGLFAVAVVGALVGLGLNGGENIFYNVLLLPAVGCATYYALRRSSLLAPVGMFALSFVWFAVQAIAEGQLVLNADGSISLSNLLGGCALWSVLYTGFFSLGLVLGGVSHAAFSRSRRFPKPVRLLAGLLAAGITVGILYFTNGLVGNPVCRTIAKNHAERMLAQEFDDPDLEIEDVGFNFKTGGYYVHVRSDSSIDTHFSIQYNGWGQYNYDTYEDVIDGHNTMSRIDDAYRSQVRDALSDIFNQPSIGYGSINADYSMGEGNGKIEGIPALDLRTLELDAQYDLAELGAQYGEVSLHLHQEDVSMAAAAQALLTAKAELGARGLHFYAIDLVLTHPREPDGTYSQDGVRINMENFLWEDIYEEGLVERAQAAHDALEAYYAAEDAKLAAQFGKGGEAIDTD